MARKARIEFSGAVYHVMDRGDRREAIFRGDRDHQMFLATLEEVCARTSWRILAYVLTSSFFDIRKGIPHTFFNNIHDPSWAAYGLHGIYYKGRLAGVISLSGLQFAGMGWLRRRDIARSA